jgi:hypothetical protein
MASIHASWNGLATASRAPLSPTLKKPGGMEMPKLCGNRRIIDDDVICGQSASEIIRSGVWHDRAPDLHFGVACALSEAGFTILPEFKTKPLGDVRDGKIDLVATRDGGRVAIELDDQSPRSRSLSKLRLFDGYRIVVLRGRYATEIPDGIDEVIAARMIYEPSVDAIVRRRLSRRHRASLRC